MAHSAAALPLLVAMRSDFHETYNGRMLVDRFATTFTRPTRREAEEETYKEEADGSIDTYGEHLVPRPKHQTMFQAFMFSRAQLSSFVTDFYVKESRVINLIADLLNVKKWWVIRINCTVGQDQPYVGALHTDTDLSLIHI